MDDVALRDRRDGSVSALLIVGVRNMFVGGKNLWEDGSHVGSSHFRDGRQSQPAFSEVRSDLIL